MRPHTPSRPIEEKRYLADLLPFAEAARCGSFSGAARALLLTPSAVSKSIARLEADFGARLFVRTTRQLQLTSDGETFLQRVQQGLATLGDAVDSLREAKAEAQGRVRITSVAAFGRHFVFPLLPTLLQRFPGLDVELQFDDGTSDPVAERFDLAVRATPQLIQGAIARPIAQLPLVLVASPAYLQRRGIPCDPGGLAGHDCVSVRLASGRPARWLFTHTDDGSRESHEPRGRLVLSEQPADAVVDAALAGLGVTAIAACMVLNELRSGRLKLLLPQWRLKARSEFFLQYPDRAHLPARVRSTAEFLMHELARDERLLQTPDDLALFAA